jgi:hypothetical protein
MLTKPQKLPTPSEALAQAKREFTDEGAPPPGHVGAGVPESTAAPGAAATPASPVPPGAPPPPVPSAPIKARRRRAAQARRAASLPARPLPRQDQ